MSKLLHLSFQGWIKKAERIRYSAPLPEDSASPILARMLVRAPYHATVEEENERSGGAKGGFHPGGKPHIVSGETRAPSSEDKREGEVDIPSSQGKKRAASEDLETEASKRGKKPSPRGPAPEGILTAQRPQGGQPSTEP